MQDALRLLVLFLLRLGFHELASEDAGGPVDLNTEEEVWYDMDLEGHHGRELERHGQGRQREFVDVLAARE